MGLLDRCGRQRRGPWKSEARGRWGTGAAGEATAREQEQGGEGEEIFWQPFRRSFGAHFDRLCARVSALHSWECVWPRPQ